MRIGIPAAGNLAKSIKITCAAVPTWFRQGLNRNCYPQAKAQFLKILNNGPMKNIPLSVKDALQKFKIPFAARVHKMLFFFGPASQKDKAVEELSELIQAITRNRNGLATDDEVREEITDAGIMLDHLRMIYNLQSDQERQIRDQKLRRAEAAYYKPISKT